MGKKKYCFCFALLWTIVIIDTFIILVLLCNRFPSKQLDFDYQGVIVGILSLLVTGLLAWNIYTVLDVKEEREKFKSTVNRDIKKLINNNNELKITIDNNFKEHRNSIITQTSNDMIYISLILMCYGTLTEFENRLPLIICKSFHVFTENNGAGRFFARSTIFQSFKSLKNLDTAKAESIIYQASKEMCYNQVVSFIEDFKCYNEEDKDDMHMICDNYLAKLLVILSEKQKK